MGVRCSSPSTSTVPVAAYLHVSIRLESPPVRFDGFGGLVPGGDFSAHQRARDESHCSGPSCVSAPVVGSECRPDERQRHGCRLSLESGWHSVLCPVSHGRRGSALD